jgi:hypothetical protein
MYLMRLLLRSIYAWQPVLVEYHSGDGQDPAADLQDPICPQLSTQISKDALYKFSVDWLDVTAARCFSGALV